MKVFATYNIKGGVGKTSTAVNLAYLAAREGRRTLLWDLDPQAAATYMFRVRPRVKGGSHALVTRKWPIEAALKATDFDINEPTQDMLFANGQKGAQDFLAGWDFDRYVKEFRSGDTVDLTAQCDTSGSRASSASRSGMRRTGCAAAWPSRRGTTSRRHGLLPTTRLPRGRGRCSNTCAIGCSTASTFPRVPLATWSS